MKKNLNGFTLSETLIVVVVLGIIATLTIPALVNKNKEFVVKTKVRKAMAAYESALNKMIIENDLKSHETLTAWAGDDENGCANSTNYFKKVQGDGCIFKTSDGIWWNISNIERPVISFKEINAGNEEQITANANNANDKTAFVLVGRFGIDGSLRVDDLAYETANSIEDTNGNQSKAQVEKLYTLLGMKKASSGGGEQAVNCDDDDIICKYKHGYTLPSCTNERKSCVVYDDEDCFYFCGGYTIYGNNSENAIGQYDIAIDGNGNEYKSSEYFEERDVYYRIERKLNSDGEAYVSEEQRGVYPLYECTTRYNPDGSILSQATYYSDDSCNVDIPIPFSDK